MNVRLCINVNCCRCGYCTHALILFPYMHLCCAVQCFPKCAVSSLHVCLCTPVSLQLSAVLREGRPQVPGVPRGVVAHSSGSRNHDAFCRQDTGGEVGGRVMRRWGIPIRGPNKESWNMWSLFRGFRVRIQTMQLDSRLGKRLPLLDVQGCGSSPHLLRQTGAGSSEVLHVRLGAALSFIQDEVRGHFALQTGDVAVAEVVTQVVHLWRQIHICQSLHHLLINAGISP